MQSNADGAAVEFVEYRPIAQLPEHCAVWLPPSPYLPAAQEMQSVPVGPAAVLFKL